MHTLPKILGFGLDPKQQTHRHHGSPSIQDCTNALFDQVGQTRKYCSWHTIYKAITRSILEYASATCWLNATTTNIAKMQTIYYTFQLPVPMTLTSNICMMEQTYYHYAHTLGTSHITNQTLLSCKVCNTQTNKQTVFDKYTTYIKTQKNVTLLQIKQNIKCIYIHLYRPKHKESKQIKISNSSFNLHIRNMSN